MTIIGPLGFLSPWLLVAGLGLPVLWFLLRAAPPMPQQLRFPGVALLAGLVDPAAEATRTPWWLLVLRMLVLVFLILGLAGPVWRPDPGGDLIPNDADSVLVVMDAGWAAAPDWEDRQTRALAAIEAAGTRPVAVLIADGRMAGALQYGSPAEAMARIRAARPVAWPSTLPDDPEAALSLTPEGKLATFWLADGVEDTARAPWAEALSARGDLAVLAAADPLWRLALSDDPLPALRVARILGKATDAPPDILAIGPDPQGNETVLARLEAEPENSAEAYKAAIDLAPELRNRVQRFVLEDTNSAGAVVLADARTRRPKLAISGNEDRGEGLELLDPGHYLRSAAAPFADLVEGTIGDVLQSAPDMVLLVDSVLPADEARLTEWVQEGGTLVRFAGPHMAASEALGDDPLLPVRLRPGGRETGGALSWAEPRDLAPWPENSPFADLPRPAIGVHAQLMAEPGPEIAARTLASLEDATPLITGRRMGEGQVILFHIAATPAWSDLPLTGLFVALLERLADQAQMAVGPDKVTEGGAQADGQDLLWRPKLVLDGWGNPRPAADTAEPVPGAVLEKAPSPDIPAGIYTTAGRQLAVNAGQAPLQVVDWALGDVRLITPEAGPSRRLGGWLILAAAGFFAADVLASGVMAGRMGRRGRRTGTGAA